MNQALHQAATNIYGRIYQPLSVEDVLSRYRGNIGPYGDPSISLLIAEIDRLRALLPKPMPTDHWLDAYGVPQ